MCSTPLEGHVTTFHVLPSEYSCPYVTDPTDESKFYMKSSHDFVQTCLKNFRFDEVLCTCVIRTCTYTHPLVRIPSTLRCRGNVLNTYTLSRVEHLKCS